MYKANIIPDEVTYSAILDVYATLGKQAECISLYERARSTGWTPDAVAFSVLAKMFGQTGDYDGIQYVLQEMRSLRVQPNVVVYNTLLEAMGKAGKPGLARNLFNEMIEAEIKPNEKTLTALIKIYGRARWGKDALELWERMRANKWPVDFILYNTLLSMCADLGLVAEAEKLFDDMKRSGKRGGTRPDSWSYTAMINTYTSSAKPEKAMELFEEMMERGVEPNVMGATCLIQCLGKAGRVRDAVKVFRVSLEKGVVPDDRLCGCLLSIIALCGEDEVDMVVSCLEKASPRLVRFVRMLGGSDEIKEEFRSVLNGTATDARRPFCNCLIDICRNRRHITSQRAHELFQLGVVYGLYPGLHVKNSREWSLNLRSLSVGAASTAVEDWMKSLSSSVENEEALPREFVVNTGAGTHRLSQGLATVVGVHLNKLEAPFRPIEEKSGSFVALKEDFVSWVHSGAAVAVTA